MVDQGNDAKNENSGASSASPESAAQKEAAEFESAAANPKLVQVTDEELKGMQKELMDYKDKYLRLLADAENARKRLQKEKQEISRYAIEGLIVDFLHPLDNFENALRFAQDMSEEVKNWAYGFQMILAQFKDVLNQNGIIAIDSLGNLSTPMIMRRLK